jgi:hypothetical protein
MVIGLLIAVLGLGATVALYRFNRDELDERSRGRILVPYVIAGVLILGVAVATVVVVDQPTQGPGTPVSSG